MRGLVVSPSSEPINELMVTVLETGSTTQTDVNGEFSLVILEPVETVTLLLERASTSATAEIGEISDAANEVEVEIELDEAAGTAEVTRKEVRTPRPRPTPRPTRTRGPQVEPTIVQVPAEGRATPTPRVRETPPAGIPSEGDDRPLDLDLLLLNEFPLGSSFIVSVTGSGTQIARSQGNRASLSIPISSDSSSINLEVQLSFLIRDRRTREKIRVVGRVSLPTMPREVEQIRVRLRVLGGPTSANRVPIEIASLRAFPEGLVPPLGE